MAETYNLNVLPKSFLDIDSSFGISSTDTDLFDIAQPLVSTTLSANITASDLNIPLDDITVFYPPDLPHAPATEPFGVPNTNSKWGRILLHFSTGEIVLIEGFTSTVGTAGYAHIAVRSPENARGLINTTAVLHYKGERVYSFVSSISHLSITQALKKIEQELIDIFDYNTGHDHSGAQLGQPIPAGGLAPNSVTETKILNSAVTTNKILDANVTLSKLDIDGTPSIYKVIGYTGSKLTWKDITLINNNLEINGGITLDISTQAAPAVNEMVMYLRSTGISPNQELAWCIKNQLNQEVVVCSVIV